MVGNYRDLTAKDIMHSTTNVNPEQTVTEIAQLMEKKVIGSVLVEIEGKPSGMVTERDLLTKVLAKGIDPDRSLQIR